MTKLLIAALSAFAIQAHANDGGIAVVDVLGIEPNGPVTNEISIYGGDTKKLFDVMPVTFVEAEELKSLYFASPAWAASIFCSREYKRPTTGEVRNDYMCTFSIRTHANSGVDDEDNNPFRPQWSDFSAYAANEKVRVLGVKPGVQNGTFFRFYGKNAAQFAAQLPSKVTFHSRAYSVELACQQNYTRPTTGEKRSDYMCALSVNPR